MADVSDLLSKTFCVCYFDDKNRCDRTLETSTDPFSQSVQMMYVFVDVSFDVEHLVESVKLEFPETTKLAVLGTIQFSSTLAQCKTELDKYFTNPVSVPHSRPLSGGEVGFLLHLVLYSFE
jgi:diphthamide biosynthesis enzyme Dph1/Dph2-like protein